MRILYIWVGEPFRWLSWLRAQEKARCSLYKPSFVQLHQGQETLSEEARHHKIICEGC